MPTPAPHYWSVKTIVCTSLPILTVDGLASTFELLPAKLARKYLTSAHFPNQHQQHESVPIEYVSCPGDYTGDDIFLEIAGMPARAAFADELLALGAELVHLPFLAVIAIDLREALPDQPETFLVPFIATNRRRSKLYAGVTPFSLNDRVDPRAIFPKSVTRPLPADIAYAFVRE